MTPPAACPYSAEKFDVFTWNSWIAAWLVEYPYPPLPRSLPEKARLWSVPYIVMLFISGLSPRKLSALSPPGPGAEPADRPANPDHWPLLLGRLSSACRSTLLLTAGERSACDGWSLPAAACSS